MAIYLDEYKWYYIDGDDIMLDCKLQQIQRVRHSIPLKIEMQTHQYDEIAYYISGNGTTEINGKLYTYKAGNFAFYKAGTPHDEYDPVPCDIIWMLFDFDIGGIDLAEGLFFDRDGRLLSVLQKLRGLFLEQKPYSAPLIESCLAEVIVTVAEIQCENEITRDKLNWKKILNYIDTNINEQIDFAAIAKANHYSYDRFRHLFTEHFGMSPYAYLTEQRIAHAKRLLKSSDSSITAIAFDCGFNSSSQFTNIFKKYVNITPKEYRKP